MSSSENALAPVIAGPVNAEPLKDYEIEEAHLKFIEVLMHGYRDFEKEANAGRAAAAAKKTRDTTYKKGCKKVWVTDNIVNVVVERFNISPIFKLEETYNLSSVRDKIHRYAYNHGIAKEGNPAPPPTKTGSMPAAKHGPDIFGADRKAEIAAEVKVKLEAAKAKGEVPRGENLTVRREVLKEMYERLSDDEKVEYDKRAGEYNEKRKDGPLDDEIYRNQDNILEHVAHIVEPILGHGWGGHGHVGLFIAGVYLDRLNEPRAFSLAKSSDANAPPILPLLKDANVMVKTALKEWGKETFLPLADDDELHVGVGEDGSPELPLQTDDMSIKDMRRLLLEFGAALYKWHKIDAPENVADIEIRLRLTSEPETSHKAYFPNSMNSGKLTELYTLIVEDQYDDTESTIAGFYPAIPTTASATSTKKTATPAKKPPQRRADYSLPSGSTTPQSPKPPASPVPSELTSVSPSPPPEEEQDKAKGKAKGKAAKKKAVKGGNGDVAAGGAEPVKGRGRPANGLKASGGADTTTSTKRKAEDSGQGPAGGKVKKAKLAEAAGIDGEVAAEAPAEVPKRRGRPPKGAGGAGAETSRKRRAEDTEEEPTGRKAKKPKLAEGGEAQGPVRRSNRSAAAPDVPSSPAKEGIQIGPWWYEKGDPLVDWDKGVLRKGGANFCVPRASAQTHASMSVLHDVLPRAYSAPCAGRIGARAPLAAPLRRLEQHTHNVARPYQQPPGKTRPHASPPPLRPNRCFVFSLVLKFPRSTRLLASLLPSTTRLPPTTTMDRRVLSALRAPPSPSDKAGTFYYYEIPGRQPNGRTRGARFKFGRARNVRQRQGQWKRKCRGQRQRWWSYWDVPYASKFEHLMHLHYKLRGAWLGRTPCDFCPVSHQEQYDRNGCGGRRVVEAEVEFYLRKLRWPIVRTDL
ncbi:hypothetical protein B0H15DRAFT_963718 [Mycena belliarum]|uniref:Bacteriophage T5 Orf172 DNA-binding domain-containing protein n=1 Tax=Mycena belliarum TaxID=1033014 RepID=A0AAD6TP14_9AGAR|nr:hypothetical protein B0H15DRAFT_963718 [Mycena belliae]